MDSFASSLLSFAYEVFGPGFCPGGAVWATSMAGALIALFPVAGAVIVALIRKFTGNRYDPTMMAVFGLVAGFFTLIMPWLLFIGVSSNFSAVRAGNDADLSTGLMTELGNTRCDFIGKQSDYLGGGQNVYEALFYPSGGLAYGYYLGALIGLPALTLLFVMLLARTALRRGPKWPARFFWIPFVLMFFFSIGVSANTAVHLWLGFLPITVLGIMPVALVGPPAWSTLRRAPAWPTRPARCPFRPVRATRAVAGTAGPGGSGTVASAPCGRPWTTSSAARSR